MEQLMISCDWGTTSFRLRLVEIENRLIMNEIISNDGVAKLYGQWITECKVTPISQEQFFLACLYSQIKRLVKQFAIPISKIPVVISGMASSSIGMKELPYASVPFCVNGSNAMVHHFPENEFRLNIYLVSGVSNGKDVMRGEETQLIGLAKLESETWSKDAICILPGTHSKHIHIKNKAIADFKTFMTGELFDVLGKHSILKNAVAVNNKPHVTKTDLEAFCKGVHNAQSGSLLHSLFFVRMNKLLDALSEEQNYFYLSGLLIGEELSNLPHETDIQIVLCSTSNLSVLYSEALVALNLSHQTIFVSPEVANITAIEGQIKILDYNLRLFKSN